RVTVVASILTYIRTYRWSALRSRPRSGTSRSHGITVRIGSARPCQDAQPFAVRRPTCDSRAVIAVGQPAPDAAFASRDGGGVRLSDLWRDKPTIFLFLRHFG